MITLVDPLKQFVTNLAAGRARVSLDLANKRAHAVFGREEDNNDHVSWLHTTISLGHTCQGTPVVVIKRSVKECLQILSSKYSLDPPHAISRKSCAFRWPCPLWLTRVMGSDYELPNGRLFLDRQPYAGPTTSQLLTPYEY